MVAAGAATASKRVLLCPCRRGSRLAVLSGGVVCCMPPVVCQSFLEADICPQILHTILLLALVVVILNTVLLAG
jgi:hypothetical protein